MTRTVAMRVAILRQPERARELCAALEDVGIETAVHPITRTVFLEPDDPDEWRTLVESAEWVVFTSVNAVHSLIGGVGGGAWLGDSLRARKTAVLGQSSLTALGEMDVAPALAEVKGTSDDLAAGLLQALAPRSRVLYPCAGRTIGTIEDLLHAAGHDLCKLTCYTTEAIPTSDRLPIDWAGMDAAVVAAPSAVEALDLEPNLPGSMVFAAIGPTTARSLRDRGFRVLGEASTPDTAVIVKLLTDECRTVRRGS